MPGPACQPVRDLSFHGARGVLDSPRMSDEGQEIAYCHACGGAMEVSNVAPFSNVGCPECGKHTRVKREFGPYTLVRTHAIGGMSVVFAAHDNTLQREVALKILNEDFSADEKRIVSFEEEARLTASISHPHVVRLLTTGRAFNRYYIAMEFVGGGHLERKIRDSGSLPEVEVLQLALEVADGLRAAHAAGLIHRDVKPGNILFDGEGNAKIVDFGLALVTQGGNAKADEIWATPYYVPPEAIDGRTEDFRSDLYAFGATLYHALAGKPPCSEETMATARLREAKKRVVPLDQAAPWLSMETCAVVDRAMAYDPGGRFRSYEELIDSLNLALRRARSQADHKPPPTTARTPSAAGKQRRSSSRRIGERIGLLAGMLAVVAAIGFGVWWIGQPDHKGNGSPVGGNGGKTKPPPKNKSRDNEISIKVGRDYAAAREALTKKDYPDAEGRFAALLNAPKVPEPTATLAGVEAAIAALLDGRSEDARARATAVVKHVDGLDTSADPACRVLGNAADRISDLKPDAPGESPPGKPADLAAALLLALKNWEQGCHQQAVGWFTQAAASKAGDNEWSSTYRQLATAYLADHEVLVETDYDTLPDTIEGCEAYKLKLDAGLKRIQTRGRASFNIHQRKLQLASHARALQREIVRNQEPDKGDSMADKLPVIKQLIAQAQFSTAVEQLKSLKPGNRADVVSQGAWVYLTRASATFIGDLAEDLKTGATGVKLSTRDGAVSYDRVTGIGVSGPQLATGEAAAVEVPWGKLSPADLIALHQQIVRNETNPLEQARRHEQAIAFQFLAGDRENAEAAAGRLAASSPAFRQRWTEAMQALKL